MVSGLWGKKIGMTQVFEGDKVVPVTAIDVAHWIVVTLRTQERDGYDAVQVGCLRKRYRDVSFSNEWLKDTKKYFLVLREIKTSALDNVKPGQKADFLGSLLVGESVDVVGITKGRGYAGTMRRHDFGGAPSSHGSKMGKRPGSLSFMRSQGKVIKGKKLSGHMGTERCMIKGLRIVKVMPESQVVLVKGSVPGHFGSLVFIRKAIVG